MTSTTPGAVSGATKVSHPPAVGKKERPILFSGDMVRAILDGRKTQTRRILKQALGPSTCVEDAGNGVAEVSRLYGAGPGHEVHEHITRVCCPYGAPGDRLWVRETFCAGYFPTEASPNNNAYRADNLALPLDEAATPPRWTPAIHMPRACSRIDLEVTAVRVERLCDISEEDARDEGIAANQCSTPPGTDPTRLPCQWCRRRRDQHVGAVFACFGGHGTMFSPHTFRGGFASLWEGINGKRAPWASNPWVWVVSFRRVRP